MLALWWCFGKWKKDSSSALYSLSTLSCLFPWGSRKNELQTECQIQAEPCVGAVGCISISTKAWWILCSLKCLHDSVSWLLLLGMSSSRLLLICLFLFLYLYRCYVGIKSHLRRGTLYSPTALVQMTAWGQVSGKLFDSVLHDMSTDLLQRTFEQKAILELKLVGRESWGNCARPQSKQLTFLLTRKEDFCDNDNVVYKIKGDNRKSLYKRSHI